MLGSLLGADTSPVSLYLLLWQHRRIPALPHPRTCRLPSPNLRFSLERTCAAPPTQPLPHLPSWAPQPIPSPHSPMLFRISHLPSSPQWFIPGPLAQVPSFLITSTPTAHHLSLLPGSAAHRWWVSRGGERAGGEVRQAPRLQFYCPSLIDAITRRGSITKMLFSVPVIGASRTALRDLLPGQPSAQKKGGTMLSQGRIRSISLKLYINIRDSSECVLTAIFRRLTICPNLQEKGKKYIHWQKNPPLLTKYWIPASKQIKHHI